MTRIESLPLPAHRAADLDERTSAHSFAFDLDGTIGNFPDVFGTLMVALVASDRKVFVLSGVDSDQVSPVDVDAKRALLEHLGIGPHMYTQLLCVPRPHAKNKRKLIDQMHIGVLVDNSKSNVKKASSECVALLLWNAREG